MLCTFFLRHPLSFVMFFVNFVHLISLSFWLLLALIPMSSAMLPSVLLLPSAPFVIVHPLFWWVFFFSDPISNAGSCLGIIINWGPMDTCVFGLVFSRAIYTIGLLVWFLIRWRSGVLLIHIWWAFCTCRACAGDKDVSTRLSTRMVDWWSC